MALRVLLLLPFMLVACGGSSSGSTSAVDDPRINTENIPEFQDIGLFPGYISGFGVSPSGFYLRDALPCLNVDATYVEDADSLEFLAIDDLDITSDVIEFRDNSYVSYCFNPFPREGVYTVDIALRSREVLVYYQFSYVNSRGPVFSISEFPGEIVGLRLVDGAIRDEFGDALPEDARILIQPLCVDAPPNASLSPGIEDLIWFTIDGRSVDEDKVEESRLGDGSRRFCLDDLDLEPSAYLLEIQLIVSPSFPPGTNNYQGVVVVVE